jgi:hypothetical protein
MAKTAKSEVKEFTFSLAPVLGLVMLSGSGNTKKLELGGSFTIVGLSAED